MRFTLNEGRGTKVLLRRKNECLSDAEKALQERGAFQGDKNDIYTLFTKEEPAILVGLGELKDLTLFDVTTACALAAKRACAEGFKELRIKLPKFDGFCTRRTVRAIVEGFSQVDYAFDRYKKREKAPSLEVVDIEVDESKKDTVESALEEAQILVDAIFHTRDLVNTPAIDMGPSEIAEAAKNRLTPLGVEVDILGREEIEKIGMKAFLAVAQGSAKEPKFLIMRYRGGEGAPIALVGKGLAYDSGGYCIKPPKSMDTMQSDMAGSATVIGAMEAIARNHLEKHVVAVAALCENMISGEAYHTGDIIGSLSGKTIEVGNTDAEGRLTLADALTYVIREESPRLVIDLATLTGACIVGLGDLHAGAVTNNEDLMAQVKRASEISDEPIWELPNHPGYREYIRSDVADVYNTSRVFGGGAITAGLFLETFVEDTPWVHLDIAGTAWLDRTIGYLPKRGTGSHVKTLYNFVKTENFNA